MSFNDILVYISYSVPAILFIGVVLTFITYRKLSSVFKTLSMYLGVALCADLLNRYFGFFSSVKYNLFLIPIFAFLEFAIFSIIYVKHILKRSGKILKIFAVVVLFAILADIVLIDMYSTKTFKSYGKIINNLSIIFFCMIFIWDVIKGKKKLDNELLILNSAVLLYFSVNLVIYLPINFLINVKSGIILIFWMINLFFTILFYSFLIYLLWQNGKTLKP